jgi:2-isopropylmalate synthase
MKRQIKIFDTTLRDGEQTPGVNLNVKEKVMIAKRLEAMNVDVIEAGFPIASNGDFEAVKAIAMEVKNSIVAGLCRASKKDIDRAWEAVQHAEKPRLHTFIATSPIHMEYKLKMTKEEVSERAVEMVKYAKSLCEDIEFSAEDAYRSDKDFLCELFAKVIEAGATTLNIPDTVGYALPHEFYEFIKYIKDNTKGIDKVDISVHCHNDLGMAVANSIAGVQAGATQVECAMNGLGERAGNAALEEVVMALRIKKDIYDVDTNIISENIYRASKLVSSLSGIDVQPNKAIVGANAFAHESGIHQDGVLKEKSTYEIITPESVGVKQESNIVLGKHSGKHAFSNTLKEMGIDLSDEEVTEAFVKFKALTDKKKNVTFKDIEAIVNYKKFFTETYKLKSFQINSGNNMICTASVVIGNGDNNELVEVAIGDGSIDAAFKAVERATGVSVELKDYSIRSVTDGKDALGEITVKIADDKGSVIVGKAIDEDIMEASINAYINAINKKLDNDKI